MAKVVDRGVTTFKHFMAYKGSLMVNDEEMFASFRRCAETRRAAARPRRERRTRRRRCRSTISPRASPGRRATRCRARRKSRARPTNRAIMLADQAGVPLYIVHTSCIAAHEAIAPRPRARQARLRRAADPASRARRERILQQGLGARGAPRHVAAVPRQEEPGRSLERPARRLAASGGDRPLLVHHQAEGARPRRLHQDPQRHRRPRRPHAGAVDLRRRHRPADDERIRRGHLDQHRAHPQPLSAQGRDPARRRRRHRRLGPEGEEDDHRRQADVGDRLQRLRGRQGRGPAALHPVARRGRRRRRQGRRPSPAAAASSSASRSPPTRARWPRYKKHTRAARRSRADDVGAARQAETPSRRRKA